MVNKMTQKSNRDNRSRQKNPNNDLEQHVKTIDEKLTKYSKQDVVIIYLTGLTILTQAFYIWLISIIEQARIHPKIILGHYDRSEKDFRFYDSLTGQQYQPSEINSLVA